MGYLQILLSGVCFGFLGVFGRWAFQTDVSPPELLGLRFLLASGLLFFITQFRFGLSVFRTPPRLLLHLALLGVFGYAVFSSFYFVAIQSLSITLAVLLLYTFPVWVTLGAWIFLKERIKTDQALVIPMVLVGLGLLIGVDFEISKTYGLLFGFGSALTYALYILLSRKWLAGVSPWVSVCYIQFFTGLTLFLVSFHSFPRTLGLIEKLWPVILGLSLICSVMAMTLFQAGLQKVKSWEASVLSTSEPLTGIFLATVFFQESLGPWQILGALLMLASFLWISRKS